MSLGDLSAGLRHTTLLLNLFTYGLALTGRGDYDEAHRTFQEALTLAEKVGEEFWGLRLLNSQGWLYSECGNLDRATDLNQRCAEKAHTRSEAETIANAELNLADIFLTRGDFALAEEFIDGISRLVRNPVTSDWMKWRYSTHLFASLGELRLAQGDLPGAQEGVNQCLEIATRTNALKYLVKSWRLQGQIALARHEYDEAEQWLQQALSLAQTVGNPTQIWQTHLVQGHLHSARRSRESAEQAYLAARTVIDQIRLNIQIPDLRTNVELSPLMQQVYELSAS
jgi:tetratricopeptide (TPR) repeat protein